MDWRLIPWMQAPGKVQMAIDNWLLDRHRLGLHPPTLRFYTWSPAAISLGYHQRQYPDFWQHLNWQGLPLELVQRPTGGRAVLHQGDLTYSIVTSGLNGDRTTTYQQICQFLIQGMRSLGLELSYGSTGRGYIHNPSCFSTATSADLILADGYKLIGSAQLKRGRAILQHGSIRLTPDSTLFKQVFDESIQSKKFSFNEQMVIEALTVAASNCFNMQLLEQPLSPEELRFILAN